MSEQDNSNLPEVNLVGERLNELKETTNTPPLLKGIGNLSMARQIGLMLGLALSVAVGIAGVLWSQSASYDLLYVGMEEKDASEMIEALDKMGVAYKVDVKSGAIMVPVDQVRPLKLKLAVQGLPRTQSFGYEILDQETALGTSKNIELMRFQRALEGEIARTVMTIQNVKLARVLLALPKQSVFVRQRKTPSASVIVSLYQGRLLNRGQVDAIVHLVSSSVPMMEASQVTVVDQKGRMLSGNSSSEDIYLTSKQFEYKQNLEEHLIQRIENILMPLLGYEGMQTQVSADIDFTVTEKTQEIFNPDLSALRSEQTQEEQSSLSGIQGVPGALSNQPPTAGNAPELAVGDEVKEGVPTSNRQSATRNFEIDKTITHTRLATGILRRLSIAVVVDNKHRVLDDGTVTRQAYALEDINQLRALVMQAVGYDQRRGDQVTVTNIAFRIPDEIEALPEISIWEQGWFLEGVKYLAAALLVLFIVFGVLRPTMRGLVARDEEVKALIDAHAEAEAMGGMVKFGKDGKPVVVPIAVPVDGVSEDADGGAAAGAEDLLLLEAPQSYEKRLEYVQKLIDEDPKLVSQLIKGWVDTDD